MSQVVYVSDETFQAEVLSVRDKWVLVDFWAEWCGPCRMLGPVVDTMATKHVEKLKVTKLNTDENPNVASQFEITGIPCCIVFKDGVEVKRIVGYRSETAFDQELQPVIG